VPHSMTRSSLPETQPGKRIHPGISGTIRAPSAVSSAVPRAASIRSSAIARSPVPERNSPTSWPSRWIAAPEAGSAPSTRNREQALLDTAAILGAGGQLLAHVAALLPIDAVQLVEPAFEQQCLLEHQVAAAIRYTEAQAQDLVVLERAAVKPRASSKVAAWPAGASTRTASAARRGSTKATVPSIGSTSAASGPKTTGNLHRRAAVLDCHLGAV